MLWLRGELRNPAINVKFYCDANFRTFGCQKLNALAARANFEIFHAQKMNFNCKFSHESLSYALNGARFWICSPRRFEWTNFFRKMFKNKKNHFFHGVRFDETWDDIWIISERVLHRHEVRSSILLFARSCWLCNQRMHETFSALRNLSTLVTV